MLAVALLVACQGASSPSPAVGDRVTRHEIHVASNGWHTAIIVPRAAVVATGLLPEAADFPDAAFLEVGWGDRVYYPAPEKTLGMALGAAIGGSPAVMHMAGLDRLPAPAGSDAAVLSVALTEAGLQDLVAAIAGDFQRPAGGRARPVSPGLYADSFFYDAHGSFHLFNTCNTWTAKTLRAAGVNVSPSGVVTADTLIARLRAATG